MHTWYVKFLPPGIAENCSQSPSPKSYSGDVTTPTKKLVKKVLVFMLCTSSHLINTRMITFDT